MRIPNEENITRFSSTVKKEVIGLQKSGYAVVKGLHYDDPFMLTFYATSLSKTHKHEDNLSFTLLDMIEWLIDPSYYSHEYQEKITAYLRSSIAHNTITADQKIPSIEPGKCELMVFNNNDRFRIKSSSKAFENFVIHRTIGEQQITSTLIF